MKVRWTLFERFKSEKDGAISKITVMTTQQGDNTLYSLAALLYDQSKTLNSKHFCELFLHY